VKGNRYRQMMWNYCQAYGGRWCISDSVSCKRNQESRWIQRSSSKDIKCKNRQGDFRFDGLSCTFILGSVLLHLHLVQWSPVGFIIACSFCVLSAKHQLKSNAVDELLAPVSSQGDWTFNDRTAHVLSTPGSFYIYLLHTSVHRRRTPVYVICAMTR